MKVTAPLLLLLAACCTTARSQWLCDDNLDTNKSCDPKLQYLLSLGSSEAQLNTIVSGSSTRSSSQDSCLLSTGFIDTDGDGENDRMFKRVYAMYGNQEREIRDFRDTDLDGFFETQEFTERNEAGQETFLSSDTNVTDDRPAFIREVEYDANGNQVFRKVTFTSGRTSTTETTYNGDAILTETTSSNGAVESVTINMYDGAGTLTTAKVYDGSGILTSTVTYEYDGNNNLISETEVFVNGDPDIVTTYKYDAQGRVVESTVPLPAFLGPGAVVNEFTTYYSDGTAAIVILDIPATAIRAASNTTFYYPPNQPTWQMTGRWIRTESYFERGGAAVFSFTDYTYSEGGRLTLQERYENGVLFSKYEETELKTVPCEQTSEPTPSPTKSPTMSPTPSPTLPACATGVLQSIPILGDWIAGILCGLFGSGGLFD